MSEKAFLFYETMGYPLPRQKEFFAYQTSYDISHTEESVDPSRELGPQMDEYIHIVKKRQWLWRRIPFVEKVYLANSMSFNALHEQSDIDVFIITTPGRLWLARLFSNVMLLCLGLKRFWLVRKKFCLSFYVTSDAMNLLSIKQGPQDPYLIYRIAHLVEIYTSTGAIDYHIWQANNRITRYLPNFPLRQSICLGVHTEVGESALRRGVEKILGGFVGRLFENIVRIVWIPILLFKKHRLGKKGDDIVISDRMLKFHADQRKKYTLFWKVMMKETDSSKM